MNSNSAKGRGRPRKQKANFISHGVKKKQSTPSKEWGESHCFRSVLSRASHMVICKCYKAQGWAGAGLWTVHQAPFFPLTPVEFLLQ